MASSNRHWPSMFKSKPCNTQPYQWQHDINSSLLSSGCHKAPFPSEKRHEPKPRWNPKPEQIQILEAIFNSGMVNPPRDHIRKIRAQLQDYGPVGDANVFYWFQNRKSRTKHKKRHLLTTKSSHHSIPNTTTTAATTAVSSYKSSPNSTCLVNQPYFNTQAELLPEPLLFPVNQATGEVTAGFTQGVCFPEAFNVADRTVGSCSGVLVTELMKDEYNGTMMLQQEMSSTVTSPPNTTVTAPFTLNNNIQGLGELVEVNRAKSTVFINDVAFEVAVGPFNVREALGDDAVLIHSSGQPVDTNEWGVTLQSLQHGAFYYLI